jgi:hypothetical protein
MNHDPEYKPKKMAAQAAIPEWLISRKKVWHAHFV